LMWLWIGGGQQVVMDTTVQVKFQNARVFFCTAVVPFAPFQTVISPGSEADHPSPTSVR